MSYFLFVRFDMTWRCPFPKCREPYCWVSDPTCMAVRVANADIESPAGGDPSQSRVIVSGLCRTPYAFKGKYPGMLGARVIGKGPNSRPLLWFSSQSIEPERAPLV